MIERQMSSVVVLVIIVITGEGLKSSLKLLTIHQLLHLLPVNLYTEDRPALG